MSVCVSGVSARRIPLCFVLCACEPASTVYLARRVAGGKRLTFPHSWGHLGHARG